MTEFITLELKNGEDVGISVEYSNNKYIYLQKIGDKITTIGIHKYKPSELGVNTDIGKIIKNYIKELSLADLFDSLEEANKLSLEDKSKEKYKELMNDLEKILKKQSFKQKEKEKEKKEEKDIYYQHLYENYCERRDSFGYSDLQFIGQVSLGMGVGLHNIILKMFINHLLTVTKIRPSNQIVHSLQASGKSFIIDQTLRLIPDEFVKNGRSTPAFFFNEYNGKDVSGFIFNFGDLGGDEDNKNTIEVRDLVKILNTDGIVERGINNEDRKPIIQKIIGYPSLTYSTVDKDIINSQEKSRGSVFSPPLIDEYQLTVFNAVQDSPGDFKETLETIDNDINYIKGLVWHIKDDLLNYELFNPYMFNITSFLNKMEDFNRKITEFNKVLFVVTYLNKPQILQNNDSEKSKKLMIASKQDVINALALFEGKDNLLPNYRLCIQKIYEEYEIKEDDLFTDTEDYNEYMVSEFDGDTFAVIDDKNNSSLKWDSELYDESNIYFTVSIIRKKFKGQSWFKRVKDNLSEVLRNLTEYGYLLKIEYGKLGNENIYCLPYDIGYQLNNINPVWGGIEFKKAKSVFKEFYPKQFDDFEEFVNKDVKKNVIKSNLELDKCNIYKLVWENYHGYEIVNNDLDENEFVRNGQNYSNEGSNLENGESNLENSESNLINEGSNESSIMWDEPCFEE